MNRRSLNWILFALIALAALILRTYAIDHLPPGLFGDEAVEGLDALDVLAGNLAVWFHAHLGREPMYVYLVALAYAAFGVSALATRLPAIVAGLLTIPAAFLFAREWAHTAFEDQPREDPYRISLNPDRVIAGTVPGRATRLALLVTALLATSFWHLQMSRDAHRDTLLPLVEAVGFYLVWRGIRRKSWRSYAAAGAVLGLAIYTYSPGRFVGVLTALYFLIEFLMARLPAVKAWALRENWRHLALAAACAVLIMLPLGLYFVQNPVQFSRRFESVSVLDADSPPTALVASIGGNLAQLVVPGAGYQSKHYNLPGKPVFDLLIAPWFLLGLLIAVIRWRRPAYRFLLLWFVVMLVPAFLTADMIPKAVRALGIVPGVFVFPALGMDFALEHFRSSSSRRLLVKGLIVLCIAGSGLWTAYDYFVTWANLPELPLAFDADMAEVSALLRRRPPDEPIYISSLVYRPPTEMLLGRQVATTRYVDRATRIREFNAQSLLVSRPGDSNALYVWVRDQSPPPEWLERIAPQAAPVEEGTYFSAVRLGPWAAPVKSSEVAFNPLLKLSGYSVYRANPRGIILYWQVAQLPDDRQDIQATLSVPGAGGVIAAGARHLFGMPPLEWALGDTIAEWYPLDLPDGAGGFKIQLTRGAAGWESPLLPLE